MPAVIVIQHAAFEGPGLLGEVLSSLGVELRVVRPDLGEAIPASLGDAQGLVVLGGAMGVYEQDRYPFLRDELQLLRAVADAGAPILGICLGSQLLAAALGAEVGPHYAQEIGWIPVLLTPAGREDPILSPLPNRLLPLQWHGDVFTLPAGAVSLARSAVTEHQAFRFGARAYGIMFHLEMTPALLAEMVAAEAASLAREGVDAAVMLGRAEECCRALLDSSRTLFTRWAGLLAR